MSVTDDDISTLINEELLVRRTKAMFLRNGGATLREIAVANAVSIATVRKDLEIVRRDINNEQPMDVIARHRAVIFDIQRAFYPAMMKGDKDAAATILRALERESKLLGLDSPTRVLAAVSADDFANEAARLIESITAKDADTLKELTSYADTTRQQPLDAEEVPLPAASPAPEPEPVQRKPKRTGSPFAHKLAGPVDAGDTAQADAVQREVPTDPVPDAPPAREPAAPGDDAAPEGQGTDAAGYTPGIPGPARDTGQADSLPDEDDDWSNL